MIAVCTGNCDSTTFTVDVTSLHSDQVIVSADGEVLDIVSSDPIDNVDPFSFKGWACSECGRPAKMLG